MSRSGVAQEIRVRERLAPQRQKDLFWFACVQVGGFEGVLGVRRRSYQATSIFLSEGGYLDLRVKPSAAEVVLPSRFEKVMTGTPKVEGVFIHFFNRTLNSSRPENRDFLQNTPILSFAFSFG